MDTIPHRLAPALSRPPGDGWLERGYEQRSSSPRVPRQGSPPPSLRLYTASSSKRRSKGLSRIRRKPYVRFLEGWATVMGSGHSGSSRKHFHREEFGRHQHRGMINQAWEVTSLIYALIVSPSPALPSTLCRLPLVILQQAAQSFSTPHCSRVPSCLRLQRKQDPIAFALMVPLF